MATRAPVDRATGRSALANDDLKRNARWAFRAAMILSLGFHAAVFAVPVLERQASGRQDGADAMQVVEIVETFSVRPDPRPPAERPSRPAAPVVPEVARVAEEVLTELHVPEVDYATLLQIEAPELPVDPRAEFADYVSVSAVMTAPVLQNRSAVRRELARRYPAALRNRGTEASMALLLWIDETGEVRRYEIEHADGSRSFDDAVAAVVPLMKFSPTLKWGRAVRVVVRVPIEFRIGA